jgi:hypothetical protein
LKVYQRHKTQDEENRNIQKPEERNRKVGYHRDEYVEYPNPEWV